MLVFFILVVVDVNIIIVVFVAVCIMHFFICVFLKLRVSDVDNRGCQLFLFWGIG